MPQSKKAGLIQGAEESDIAIAERAVLIAGSDYGTPAKKRTAKVSSTGLVSITGTVTPTTGTYTDRSGTITTGATAQSLAVANTSRQYLYIHNTGAAVLWFDFGTTAVQSQPSIKLEVGAAWVTDWFIPTGAVSIIGPTTGQAFTAKEA